ncbi:MAG: sigma-70 family RNA polymerase sigma factor [Bacteroidota bacterium]
MTTLSDETIIQNLQSQNPEIRNRTLSHIYQVNYSMIAHFIKKNSGTEADAEDIFQDSLIALYNKANQGTLVLSASLQTYIYSIAKNLWLKKLRVKKRNVELKDTHENFPVDEDIFDNIVKNERDELIADMLQSMGEDCKKVLQYFYFDKYKMKQIMELMGWQSEQVAKNKKSNCMKKLKTKVLANPGYRTLLK